jgi:hypothetical protein
MSTTSITTVPVPTTPARKSKRIFMWTFLAIQGLFIAWVISGIMSHTGATTAEVNAGCLHGAWQGLFQSQSDCLIHYRNGLNQAATAGTAIGVGIVIVFWAIVDIILGIGRLVVLTSRKRKAA